jgi:hypothetical protein
MKTLVKNGQLTQTIEVKAAQTAKGKACLSIVTDKRLSKEDFRDLMLNIQLAGGYGFLAFVPELKGKFISAVRISETDLKSLVNAYVWNEPETKEVKAATKKAAGKGVIKGATKNPDETDNTLNTFTPEQIKQALAILSAMKK